MSNTEFGKVKKRIPLAATVLSLIMPGLGHIYCGRLTRGIIIAFLSCVFIPVIFGAFSVSHSSVRIIVIVGSLLVFLAIWLVAIVDSWRSARRTAAGYALKDYNRWYVYVILMLMGTCSDAAITLHVRAKLVEAFRVPAASDYPTIVPNDRFLANKLAYITEDPKRGDLVVFICPENRRIKWIKRVVALAGDTVEIKGGELYINDQKLGRRKLPQSIIENIKIKIREEWLTGDVFEETNGDVKYKIFLAEAPHNTTAGDFAEMIVPMHHCFVLGDNRNLSRDSRHVGPIPLATIIGRADYLYWPAKDWSRFGRINN